MHFIKFKPNKYKKHAILALMITAIVISNLFFSNKKTQTYVQPFYTENSDKMVGSTACKTCHKAIYESHINTAHFNDSKVADLKSVKGSFANGQNVFNYNLFMNVAMIKDGKKLIQSARIGGEEVQRAGFDLVIGSGRKGQSYLYWDNNKLFQLPISYYTATNSWCNSPGFPNFVYYERPIPLNCLECHSTYAKTINEQEEFVEYDKKALVLGIDCERCHGAGGDHVAYQVANPKDTIGRYIVNTAHKDRQVRLDGCALCHSGIREPLKPPFSFKVGDTLNHFSVGKTISHQADTLDVHGNQYGLLAASKCFLQSTQMDCSSCHNVHKNEFNDPKLYSQRCMSCHNQPSQTTCTVKVDKKIILSDNCIDCHMPILASKKIQLNVSGGQKLQPDYIRTHFISIYREESRKFLEK